MIVVFSMTAGLTGLEIGVAGGTAVVGQRYSKPSSARTPCAGWPRRRARTCTARCQRLLQAEQQRFLDRLDCPTGCRRTSSRSRPRRSAGWRTPHEPAHAAAREASQLHRRLEALNEARELAGGCPARRDPGRGAARSWSGEFPAFALRRPHRGGLLRRDRQRQIIALQRRQRRGNRDRGRPASHHVRTARRHLGRRGQRRRCSTGWKSATGTTPPRSPDSPTTPPG